MGSNTTLSRGSRRLSLNLRPTVTTRYFTPPVTTGLRMHIDVNDPSTVYKDNVVTQAAIGDKVYVVQDKSGTGAHWVQGTAANQATLAVQSNIRTLFFPSDAGIGNYHYPFSIRSTDIRTAFWVLLCSTDARLNFLMGDTQNPPSADWHAQTPYQTFLVGACLVNSLRFNEVTQVAISVDRPMVRMTILTATTSSNAITGDFSYDRVIANRSFSGWISMLLTYNAVLTADQILATEEALRGYCTVAFTP